MVGERADQKFFSQRDYLDFYNKKRKSYVLVPDPRVIHRMSVFLRQGQNFLQDPCVWCLYLKNLQYLEINTYRLFGHCPAKILKFKKLMTKLTHQRHPKGQKVDVKKKKNHKIIYKMCNCNIHTLEALTGATECMYWTENLFVWSMASDWALMKVPMWEWKWYFTDLRKRRWSNVREDGRMWHCWCLQTWHSEKQWH